MKRILSILIVIITVGSHFGQSNEIIKISSERNEGIIKIFAENIAKESYEVEININSKGFKHTNTCPITVTLQGGEKAHVTTLIAKKDEEASYSISLKYTPTHPEVGQKVRQVASEISKVDISEGVFVFSKEGCGRCKHVERFLSSHNIPYTKLNISKNPGDNSLMWTKLNEAGYTNSSVATPVISVDGKLHTNPELINDLLKELNQKYSKN